MAASSSTRPFVYRKLTRLHRGLGLMSHLWLGSDHLLHVTSTGYTENYRRCYLRDIQTVLIVHTPHRLYVAITLGVVMWIAAMIMMVAGSGRIGYAILAGIFAPFFIWNHLLGAGCRVVITTAVQQEKIGSLSRLPKTRRVIAQLKPLIEAAQSELETTEHAEAEPHPTRAPMPTGSPLPPPLPPS